MRNSKALAALTCRQSLPRLQVGTDIDTIRVCMHICMYVSIHIFCQAALTAATTPAPVAQPSPRSFASIRSGNLACPRAWAQLSLVWFTCFSSHLDLLAHCLGLLSAAQNCRSNCLEPDAVAIIEGGQRVCQAVCCLCVERRHAEPRSQNHSS